MSTRHIAAEHAEARDLTPRGIGGGALRRFRRRLASDGFAVDEGWRPKPGYLYTVVRAISARVNQNWDGWPSEELKKSYRTFIGKPCFVNHENHDPTKARGVVVAARYVENGMDKYIEVVQEIDAERFPKLAHEIKTGGLDSVSMGAEAGFTICSYCHNKATDVPDMCDHVLNHKGKTLTRFDKRTGRKEDVLVFESCLVPGTPVLMADGTTKGIEQVRVGDRVVDHLGESRLVTETMSRLVTEDIVRLRRTGHPGWLELTGNHPLLVVRSADAAYPSSKNGKDSFRKAAFVRKLNQGRVRPEFVEAAEVREGDWVVEVIPQLDGGMTKIITADYTAPRNMDWVGQNHLPDTSGDEEFFPDGLYAGRWKNRNRQPWIRRSCHAAGCDAVMELRPSDRARMYCSSACAGTWRKGKNVGDKNGNLTRHNLPDTIELTESFGRLVGWFLAEGSASSAAVNFALHADEAEQAQEIVDLVRDCLGLTSVTVFNPTPTTLSVTVFSAPFARMMSVFGTQSAAKGLPDEFMSAPLEFLRGVADAHELGDGLHGNESSPEDQRKDSVRPHVHRHFTVSDRLASQLYLVHLMLGRTPSHTTKKAFRDNWLPLHDVWWKNLAARHGRNALTVRGKMAHGPWVFTRVRDVENRPYSGPVHNLEVADSHTYTANGLAVHNCHKISFFELSYVFEPADETAVASKVVVAGKTAALPGTCPDNDGDGHYFGWGDECQHCGIPQDEAADEMEDRWRAMMDGPGDEDLREQNKRRAEEGEAEHRRQWGLVSDEEKRKLNDFITYPHVGDTDPDENLDPFDPRIIGASRRTAEDVTVPAIPGTPTIDQSVIDATPVIELTPATELTGHEAPGVKQGAFAADIAEITKLAGECPPGMDCSRKMPQGEQITKDSPNNPVNQVSADPNGTGASNSTSSFGKPPAQQGGGDDTGGSLKPQTLKLQDSLKQLYPGAEIGGYRPPDGYNEHSSGSALDFMTTDHDQAKSVMDHAFANGANYVIWDQKQWNPDGSTSVMEDRGSPTQNHKDHVHINIGKLAGKYTKEDFNHPSGLKPWERDKESDAEDAAAIEIEAMMLTAGATDDYLRWKEEHGEEADAEGTHGINTYFPSWEQKRWLDHQDALQRRLDFTAAENLTNPEHSRDTTRRNTINTYLASHALLNSPEVNAPQGDSLDYGAGWGDSATHPDLRFHTLEPHPNKGMVPNFYAPEDIDDGSYRRIHSLNVLNVAERHKRDDIVAHIGRILAPGGHAVITTRGAGEIASMLNSPDHRRGPESDPGSVLVNGGIDPKKKPDVRVRYQKGFTPAELHQYVQSILGDGYTVRRVGVGSAPAAVHIVRNIDNVPARPPRPLDVQMKAAAKRRKVRSAALRKVAHNRAVKLSWGEQEAPMAVDTLREEGSAPEDDNNDFEQYVDKPDFENPISSPEELQDPDLSQAAQVDRQQEMSAAGADTGQPGPGSTQPDGGDPQQQFMTLQIPLPAAQQAGVPMAAEPVQAPAPQPPMQMAASLLDYFDGYYGRRIANWLDAIESSRAFTPEEAADYRRQAARLSTLENRRELSTTDRNPGKEPADMARNTIASRNKVARAGRRQHLAEGPYTDGGPYGRNDLGEQSEAFISQTPPPVPGDFVTDGEKIHNTEHNLVARVQQGRAQLLRDAQALASLRQRRGFEESGGPVAEIVDPTVHTGPEGEALTGTDFVSANPNDGVKPTNPHDASLRAFQAFDGWLAQKTGKSSRRHTEANIKKAAAQFSREAGISPQALFPALGIVLREARKSDKQANTRGAKMRKRADEKLEVAAPDGRIDVESPVENVTSAEAQASQFDIHDFGNNAGDNVAKPDLRTDQNWAPGEASGKKASVKTAGGLLAMRCAEGMIAAGLEPNSRERKYQLAAEFESMNRGLIQDRVALLERFASVREADRRKVASGSSRGAARSPIPAGLGGGTRTASAGQRLAAHDPSNDSSLFI